MTPVGPGHRFERLSLAALLRCYPREFRVTFGADMLTTYATARADCRSGLARFRLWRDTAASLIAGGVAERMARATTPTRSPKGPMPMKMIVRDFLFALRIARARPLVAATTLLTLALGIGAITAVFSVVNAVLIQPLPYPNAGRLVALGERTRDGDNSTTSFATVADWRAQSQSFDAIAAMSYWPLTITSDGPAQRYEGMRVSHEFFATLGVKMLLGRDFNPDDDVPAHRRRAILSYAVWQDRFHGDPSIVGRTITLSGIAPYEVLGVLPREFVSVFSGPSAPPTEVWAPLAYDATLPQACRTCRHLRAIGRLAPGVKPAQASAEMDGIFKRLVAAYPADYETTGASVELLQEKLVGRFRPALLVLLGAVAFVLLIACANVAHLRLGELTDRHREFAIRTALGAGRGHIVMQLLVESVALGLAGGSLGLLVANWGTAAAMAAAPPGLPSLDGLHINATILVFTVGASIAAGLIFGLGPAFMAGRRAADDSLRSGGRVSAAPSRRRFRQVVILSDVALALVLLTGAGLMIKSVGRLLDVSPGFDRQNLLTMQVDVSGPAFDAGATGQARLAAYYDDVLRRVGAIPGVESAGAVSLLPLGGDFDRYGVEIDGRPAARPEDAPVAERYIATSSYFSTMRIPIIRGRALADVDTAAGEPVVLVGETFSRRSWPGTGALGARIRIGGPEGRWMTVVGIVGDVRHDGLDVAPKNEIYVPFSQFVDSTMTILVRTSRDAAAFEPAVRQAIWSVDRNQPILHVATMDQVVARSLSTRRFAMLLLEGFAVVAFILAAMGIYGVIAFSVTQQTREIGVRIALGGSPRSVVSAIVASAARVTAAGVAIGWIASMLLTRFLAGLLFDVSATDAPTFGIVAVLVGLMGVLAAAVPAFRASRIDPLRCLRAE